MEQRPVPTPVRADAQHDEEEDLAAAERSTRQEPPHLSHLSSQAFSNTP